MLMTIELASSLTSDNRRFSGVSPFAPTTQLTVAVTTETGLAPLAKRARDFIDAAKAPNTRKAYRSDWNDFTAWCEDHGLSPLPAAPETVALYLSDLAATHRPSTMRRRLTAISAAHKAARKPSPATMDHAVVSETLKGIRRTLGVAQTCKSPLLTADLRKMIAAVPDGLLGSRDRALLLLGFAGAFRRSELAALNVEDIALTDDGLVVTIRRSKCDQEAEGRRVAIPWGSNPDTCPVRAFKRWITETGITTGAVFRSVNRHGHLRPGRLRHDSIGRIVKAAAVRAGLDPRPYAGHSLRAGLATQSYLNGANELSIMEQTGHRSLAMVRRYIRDTSLFRDNPASRLGL
jgi:integrase